MGNKKRLKAWQLALIALVAVLFIVATIVLCFFYKDAIFTENTFSIVLICASAVVFVIMCAIGWRFFKK